jgi:hypothetical protein
MDFVLAVRTPALIIEAHEHVCLNLILTAVDGVGIIEHNSLAGHNTLYREPAIAGVVVDPIADGKRIHRAEVTHLSDSDITRPSELLAAVGSNASVDHNEDEYRSPCV